MSGHHHCGADLTLDDLDHAQTSPKQIKERETLRRILIFALIINGGMFVVEIIASSFSNSLALQADAVDFFSDAATYAISLLVLGSALVTRAKAAIFKGVCMAAFGVFVLISALLRLYSGEVPEASIMGVVAFMALIANVSVAMALFAYRGGDSNMRSVWLCSRNDAVANIAVLLAAVGVFASSTRWPDLAVAMVIACLSLSAAYQVIRQALRELSESKTRDHATHT